MDLANSSIWDNKTGFGGDGDPRGQIIVGDGRCVIDGPFSKLRPIVYNHTFSPHCLSRGFRDKETFGQLTNGPYSPESIGEILTESRYEAFVQKVEYHLHNTMHQSIAGDFLAMTAANGKKSRAFSCKRKWLIKRPRSHFLSPPRTTRSFMVAMATRKARNQTEGVSWEAHV